MPAAAARFLPEVAWRATSLVRGDFTCPGRTEYAILGITQTEIVVAVFVDGVSQRPQVLRYSAAARSARDARLTVESLDYDPRDEIGDDLPGFRRSRTCKGLNLTDDRIDSAHIYWNHALRQFDDWVR